MIKNKTINIKIILKIYFKILKLFQVFKETFIVTNYFSKLF